MRMILIRCQGPRWRLPASVLIWALAMTVGACSSGDAAIPAGRRPVVVVTTTILGDVVGELVQDDGTVETLIPIGADPHEFQLSSVQAARLRTATLVVANGLALEQGMTDALASAQADGATILEIGPELDPRPFVDAADEKPRDVRSLDPHVWMDPLRMAHAAELIGQEIAALDDTRDDSVWTERAARYARRLRELDDELRTRFDRIPPDRRVLVTNHDAFGYLASRYGFEILGTVVPGGSPFGEPSSKELAHLVDVLRQSGAPAIFTETSSSEALARAVASQLNRPVAIVRLYTGSLGEPGSGADSYIGMMETDARKIVDALTGTASTS